MNNNDLLRQIPSIEQVLIELQQDRRFAELHHEVWVSLLRQATRQVRQQLLSNGGVEGCPETTGVSLVRRIIEQAFAGRMELVRPSLRRVVNATGVVLHTNLGRAPLSERARAEVCAVMEGYSTLEYEVSEGRRGERYAHVAQRIEELTGAESAIVVNNNAAAVLLTLAGLARGREVIVSRGELVEIGGSFRIPDVIRQSGAILVEVGTTNKTHLADYEAAITPDTAVILKVHTSNFAVVGFTSQPAEEQLCKLARDKGLISVNDVGSGTLLPVSLAGHREPTVQDCVTAGFDLVTFSGDKLLGAGQAGIIAGKKQYIDRLKREPLLRAVRIDKLSLAALEGTLIDYATGRAEELIPGWSMLTMTEDELASKAEKLITALAPLAAAGWKLKKAPTRSLAGGGSLPGLELIGCGVEATPAGMSVVRLEKSLREAAVPIISLIRDDAVIFDLRCLRPGDDQIICTELLRLAGGSDE